METVHRRPPPAAGSDYIHAATGGQVYERREGQLAAIARRVGTFSAAQACEHSLNKVRYVVYIGPTTLERINRPANRPPAREGSGGTRGSPLTDRPEQLRNSRFVSPRVTRGSAGDSGSRHRCVRTR